MTWLLWGRHLIFDLIAIRVTSMTNLKNDYPILGIFDFVDDSVDAYTDAVTVLISLELSDTVWSGSVFKGEKNGLHPIDH